MTDLTPISLPHAKVQHRPGPNADANLALGWASLAAGALTGLVLGLWSFDGPVSVPAAIGEYGDLSRRLLRLGHIAFFGLGMLNIMLARHLAHAEMQRGRAVLALRSMNFGNLFLPLTLIVAAFVPVAKYLTCLPALAVTLALLIGALAAFRPVMKEYRK